MINYIEQILAACDRQTLSGQRDYAILRLLTKNSLKRQQVAAINISDFDIASRSLQIQKRYQRQTQSKQIEIISLSLDTANALQDWLNSICIPDSSEATGAPLFIALDRVNYGHRLTGTAIYGLVKRATVKAGLTPTISPEHLRNQDREAQNQTHVNTNESHSRIDQAIALTSSQIDQEFDHTFTEFSSDILTALLADKRSLNTRRAYGKDLDYFFWASYGQKPTELIVSQFLRLNRFEAIAIVLRYKSDLITKNLKEATINRRLSALKSLVNFAAKLGKCHWNLDDIQTEAVQSYRDTTGVTPDKIRNMLLDIDRDQPQGKRDFAILRLLWDNALRRNEVASTNISDFDYEGRSLQIFGKGRGSQKSIISLNIGTANAIQAWLAHVQTDIKNQSKNKNQDQDQPLFYAIDRGHYGHRLTGTAIYEIVSQVAKNIKISKQMSPHRVRHSAITAALDATNGNVRKVQKLSRHKKIDTLMLYDDNRTNMQGEISSLLGDLI
jgi:integrase/recombinase XerC